MLSDAIIALSKRGQLDSAAALLNSKGHDLARVATINTFSGIVTRSTVFYSLFMKMMTRR